MEDPEFTFTLVLISQKKYKIETTKSPQNETRVHKTIRRETDNTSL